MASSHHQRAVVAATLLGLLFLAGVAPGGSVRLQASGKAADELLVNGTRDEPRATMEADAANSSTAPTADQKSSWSWWPSFLPPWTSKGADQVGSNASATNASSPNARAESGQKGSSSSWWPSFLPKLWGSSFAQRGEAVSGATWPSLTGWRRKNATAHTTNVDSHPEMVKNGTESSWLHSIRQSPFKSGNKTEAVKNSTESSWLHSILWNPFKSGNKTEAVKNSTESSWLHSILRNPFKSGNKTEAVKNSTESSWLHSILRNPFKSGNKTEVPNFPKIGGWWSHKESASNVSIETVNGSSWWPSFLPKPWKSAVDLGVGETVHES